MAAIDIHGGIWLHYVHQGEGDTVVLLHGGVGDCWSWRSQISAFAPCFRTIAYSRRYNFPNRNPIGRLDYSSVIDAHDLGHLLDALGCDRAHLIGTSYGALTALHFATFRPAAVASLVLVEPPVLRWLSLIEGGDEAISSSLSNDSRPAQHRRRTRCRQMQPGIEPSLVASLDRGWTNRL
jgi:pimeloyl-ACP methyl ester carboxylesterase